MLPILMLLCVTRFSMSNGMVQPGLLGLILVALFIFIINFFEYERLAALEIQKKEILAFIVNVIFMIFMATSIDNEAGFIVAAKAFVATSLVALFIAYYALIFDHIPFEGFVRSFGGDGREPLTYLNDNNGVIRLTGPFYDPNFFGVYLLNVIILCYWLSKFHKASLGLTALLVFCVVSLVMTMSRTALIGFFMFMLVAIFYSSTRVRLIALVAAPVLLSGVIAFLMSNELMSSQLLSGDSINERMHFYIRGWSAFMEGPFFGSGTVSILDDATGFATAHNVYLSILAKYGVAGFVLYMMLVFFPVLMLIMKWYVIDGRYKLFIISVYSAYFIMYISYDFLNFLEFQYYIFGMAVAAMVSGFGKKAV